MKNKKARLWMRTAILVVFVAAVVFTLYEAFHKDAGPAVGEKAPNFELQTLDGKSVKLSDFRGKGVLLNFWGSWCEPCKQEMPYLNAVYQQHMKGVVILGVDIGEPKLTVSNFTSRNGIKFPILLDLDKTVTTAYNIGPIPTTYLIDKTGKIVKVIKTQMPDPGFIQKQLELIQPDKYNK
ncbi:MAG TPA: thiol-disulfide oxidoreductase ResA [Bacillales bacterium]|nr:thiol-disulfide oxidoreductase ResA [Bacillales bacterium]